MQPEQFARPRLYFGTESRFHRNSTGGISSPHPGDRYEIYQAWRRAFSEVVLLARVAQKPARDDGYPVEGTGVRVEAIQNFTGPRGAAAFSVRSPQLIAGATPDDAAWFGGKLPGVIGSALLIRAERLGQPFFANVVGDPGDVLRAGTLGLPGRVLSAGAAAFLRRQMRRVDAGVYVSQEFLQRRYPVRKGVPTLARSNVELPTAAFAHRKWDNRAAGPIRLISIGSHEQRYKGHDLLIRAVHQLRGRRHAVHLHLVGGGRHHEELQHLARKLSVKDQVVFHGHVTSIDRVRSLLDQSDIYVQPSRTEGLPRAVVEAMARSLPCVGSTAGAIPELLDPAVLFAVNDVTGLTTVLEDLIESPEIRQRLGRDNHDRADEIATLSDPDRYGDFLVSVVQSWQAKR